MSYTVIFDKNNSVHGGISKIEIIDLRIVATYTDGQVIDLGPASGVNTSTTNHAVVTEHALVIEDTSLVRNYETLYGQLQPITGNVVYADGNQIITGTKTFKAVDSSNNTIGTAVVVAGTNVVPEIQMTLGAQSASYMADGIHIGTEVISVERLKNIERRLTALEEANS